MYVVSPREMQLMDRRVIDDVGVPGVVLMDRAARGAVEELLACVPLTPGDVVGILCGTGNNGGDGLAMATMLHHQGFDPRVVVLGSPESVSGDAAVYLEVARRTLRSLSFAPTEEDLLHCLDTLKEAKCVCDALLGTGLDRPVEGRYRRAVEYLQDVTAPLVAVDIPSGVDGLTGRVLGCAAPADLTVTFAFLKLGHLLDPGRQRCGELAVVDIGIPEAVRASVGCAAEALDLAWVEAHLHPRPLDLHKGRAGRTLHVGGRRGAAGAIALSARGALVGGAGLIYVGSEEAVAPGLLGTLPEVMAREVFADGGVEQEELASLLDSVDAVVVGPGLGLDDVAGQALDLVLRRGEGALVLDADALTLVAGDEGLQEELRLRAERSALILTPHPGEMSRLMGRTVAEILDDAPGMARDLAERWGVIVVLKTAATVVAGPTGLLGISRVGNPGMATGGMGDALTGLIAAALAGGDLSPRDAACLGVAVHGLAGDEAARSQGHRGVTVTGLLDHVGALWRACEP